MTSDIVINFFSKFYNGKIHVTERLETTKVENRFFIIPGKDGPRWIIPQNPDIGLSVLYQWHPYDLISKIKWKILLCAYKKGIIGEIPGIKGIGINGNLTFDNRSSSNRGKKELYLPITYIGTPGKDQKAVSSIISANSLKNICIRKIPLGKNASKKIIDEAAFLDTIKFKKPNIAPGIIFLDKEKGVSDQEVVAGRLTSRKFTDQHLNWLVELADGNTTTINKHCLSLLDQLKSVDKKIDSLKTKYIKNIIERIDDATILPSVWFHGDFAPWNLKWNQNELKAIDWEEAKKGYLPLQDLIHFFVIQNFLFKKKKNLILPLLERRFVYKYLELLKIPISYSRRLALYYMVSSWITQKINNKNEYSDFLLSSIKQIDYKLL